MDNPKKLEECVKLCMEPMKQAEVFIYTKKKKLFDIISASQDNLPSDTTQQAREENLAEFKNGEKLYKQSVFEKFDEIISKMPTQN